MIMKLRLLLLLPLAATAQFHCVFSGAQSETDCINNVESGNSHCVWCEMQSLSVCVSAAQAAKFESSVPGISCTRYHGDDDSAADDDEPAADDDEPTDDDEATDDDNTPSNDDDLPDNYWKCLEIKTSEKCDSSGCVWCDTKGGFGLCLSGPSAESAKESDWFKCDSSLSSPSDTSCIDAFLKDPTADGCTTSQDQDGKPCSWCSLNGITNVCLTQDQAQLAKPMGMSCAAAVQDPYDPSCALAYLQDQSKEACEAALDEDGNACEYCSVQGAVNICLNQDQAQMVEQFGVECDENVVENPYDPSCLVAYLQNESEADCLSALDSEGNSCQLCSIQGFDLCLTPEQAETGQQIGFSCKTQLEGPEDPSCLLAYLQDPSEDGCKAAQDQDGNDCEYCSIGSVNLCLNADQAEIGEQLGVKCDEDLANPYDPTCELAFVEAQQSADACKAAVDAEGSPCKLCHVQGVADICLTLEQAEMSEQLGIECDDDDDVKDPYDPSCALAYLQDQTQDACEAAVDSDGNACEFCTLQGAVSVCLNQEQASMGEQFGLECGQTKDLSLPPDFFTCLENSLDESDCVGASCTWCHTQPGMNFCLSTAAAEATKDCSFFDCEFSKMVVAVE